MILSFRRWKAYAVFIAVTLVVGAAAGLLVRSGINVYEQQIVKPALTPPAFVFPIVWTVLYLLMGIGAAMIFLSDSPEKTGALAVYAAQLIVNFCWSIIFFNDQAFLFSFVWLILLIILICIMIAYYLKINKYASFLQIPYLVWVLFAGYLNFMIYLLNR